MGELDGVGDVVLGDFARANLDHVDIVLGAGNDEIKVAVLQLLDGGVEGQLPVNSAHANVRDRRYKGDI